MITNRVFRPIPFKSLSDIKDESRGLSSIIRNCIVSDKISIQDSVDMVVEDFTMSELRDLEFDKGIEYSCISFCGDDGYTLFDDMLDVCSPYGTMYFLNDKLRVDCYEDEDSKFKEYMLDNYFDKDFVIFSYFMRLRYNKNTFELKLVRGMNADLDYDSACDSVKTLLFINNKYVCEIESKDNKYAFPFNMRFELVQVCKTKKGFDFILSFEYPLDYIGFSLSSDLELLYTVNLDKFTIFDKNSNSKYRSIIAKSKLLYS